MEFIQGYFPEALALYNNYSPYLLPIYRSALYAQSFFYRTVYPLLFTLYTLLNNYASPAGKTDSSSIFALLLLALILFITLRVLDYVRKTIIYWISLAIRLIFWFTVLGFVVYVYQRGLEKSFEDFGWVVGLLQALGEEGERRGGQKARLRESEAKRARAGAGAGAGAGMRGRTRGAGW